jgi:hypothetical protein
MTKVKELSLCIATFCTASCSDEMKTKQKMTWAQVDNHAHADLNAILNTTSAKEKRDGGAERHCCTGEFARAGL